MSLFVLGKNPFNDQQEWYGVFCLQGESRGECVLAPLSYSYPDGYVEL